VCGFPGVKICPAPERILIMIVLRSICPSLLELRYSPGVKIGPFKGVIDFPYTMYMYIVKTSSSKSLPSLLK
jgi:hypothetical protein